VVALACYRFRRRARLGDRFGVDVLERFQQTGTLDLRTVGELHCRLDRFFEQRPSVLRERRTVGGSTGAYENAETENQ
jgi:hypothetical protein